MSTGLALSAQSRKKTRWRGKCLLELLTELSSA
jgi:hypothetical protein